MRKIICIVLALCCVALPLSGCDRKVSTPQEAVDNGGDFAPQETAAAASSDGGLVGAMEAQNPPQEIDSAEWDAASNDFDNTEPAQDAQDAPADAQDTSNGSAPAQPFVSPTPQPNTAVSGYSSVVGTGLGFKFDYPTGWTNVPGRSTVCYVQPLENGTVYPARVAVTMKQLLHKCSGEKEFKEELASYFKTLRSQYDESSFQIDMELDTATKFMGNDALATTYLAYDGSQEIQGYVIMTYFERYLFCFHFLCAYDDYEAFQPAMRHMRDSVQANVEQAS